MNNNQLMVKLKTIQKDESSYKMKDEMNFADVSGIVFADNPCDLKTVVHEEEKIDFSSSKRTKKRITISASANCELPKPSDAKVLVALISLTAPGDFCSQKVHFRQRDILEILNWSPGGASYSRLKAALKRLRGVRFVFENSWYVNGDKKYVSKDFNIIDELNLVDYERGGSRIELEKECYFKWSDTIYQSFKDNNVKDIQLELLQSLSDLAFAIYRFLDKAFYFKSTLEFDFDEFVSKMGIKPTEHNNPTKIRNRLLRAFTELEKKDYIEPLPKSERFIKVRRGVWKIVVTKKGSSGASVCDELFIRLTSHGVKSKQAAAILKRQERDYVLKVIEYFEQVVLKKTKVKSRGGWLNSALSSGEFEFPDDFRSSVEREKVEAALAAKRQVKNLEDARRAQEEAEEEEKLQAYWKSLSKQEREELEAKAVLAASESVRVAYKKGKTEKNEVWKAIRKSLIKDYVQVGRRCS